jgi:cell division protein FtsA
MTNFIVGLDIGSSKICVVVGEPGAGGTLEILGLGQSRSRGVRDGEIVKPELVVEDVREAVLEAGQMADVKIRSVYLGATGDHICGLTHCDGHSMVPAISPDDVGDAVKNAIRLVRAMPLEVDGIVFNGLASALALLTSEQMELGALVIDIGAGTTEFVVFADGILRFSGILLNGGRKVSNDLAEGLEIPISRAEKLKLEHGSAVVVEATIGQTVAIADEPGLECKLVKIEQMQLIMTLRLARIFWDIAQDLEAAGLTARLRAGAFLCGGTARTPGIVAMAEKILQMKVTTGSVVGISRLTAANQPEFASAIGLVKYGALRHRPN